MRAMEKEVNLKNPPADMNKFKEEFENLLKWVTPGLIGLGSREELGGLKSLADGPGGVDKFFIADSKIPAGTRVVASLSASLKNTAGVLVPNEAVIWYSGKPWIFKQLSDGVFARVEIDAAVDLGAGWFEVETLRPGDKIIVSGAQLLLSEELKYQIRNENED